MSLDSILRSVGKNLFDISSVTGFVNSSGNIMSENNMRIQNGSIIANFGMYGLSCMTKEYVYLPVGTYTISADVLIDNANANPVYIGLYELDKKIGLSKATIIPLNQTTRISATINVVENSNYHILTQGSGKASQYINLNAVFSNIQLEENSTATSYEPYHQGPKSITIPSDSKNLIKYPYDTNTTTINGVTFTVNSDGGITVNGTATTTAVFYIKSNFITLTPNKQYTLSGFTSGTGCSLNLHSAGDLQNIGLVEQHQTKTFTASYEKYYCYLAIGATKTANATFYPQLEEGITATDYSLNTGDKEVLKVSYGSRNLWQNTNTTFPSTLSYDSNTQTYTTGTGTAGYMFVAHTLTNPIPVGTTVTISIMFQSGKGESVVIGGYHCTGAKSWQGHIDVPKGTDMTGQTLTGTFTTTETVEEFVVSHNTGDNIEEPFVFQVQYELGDKATKYVPYSREVVWTKTFTTTDVLGNFELGKSVLA